MKKAWLVAVVLVFLRVPAWADNYTYTYTGQDFDFFTAPSGGPLTYACPPECNIMGWFSVSAPLPNSGGLFETITPSAYSFTDGHTTMTQTNSTVSVFQLVVNSSGDITSWDINIIMGQESTGGTLWSFVVTNGALGTGDDSYYSNANYPYISDVAWTDSPGKWSGPAVVPEPASALLFGCGLAALAGMIKSRRSARGAADAECSSE